MFLFLHGFTGSGNDWDTIVSQVEQSSFCPDLPFHGAHTQPKWEVNFPNTALWLCTEIDKRTIDKCIPIGYSMGGRVALQFALKYPEKCQALILESCSFGISDIKELGKRKQLDANRALGIMDLLLNASNKEEVTQKWLTDWYNQPLFKSLSKVQKEVLIHQKKQNDLLAWALSLSRLGLGVMPNFIPQLRKLKMPVLLISGKSDVHYTQMMQKIQKEIPNATHVVLEAGHNVHLENPEAYVTVIKDFLSKLP